MKLFFCVFLLTAAVFTAGAWGDSEPGPPQIIIREPERIIEYREVPAPNLDWDSGRDFDLTQFNRMSGLLKTTVQDISSFQADTDKGDEVEYFSISSVKARGTRSITEYIGVNSNKTVILVSWFMDGNAAQEKTEYQNIVALLKQQLGNPHRSSDTYSAWEAGNTSCAVSLEIGRVRVSAFTAGGSDFDLDRFNRMTGLLNKNVKDFSSYTFQADTSKDNDIKFFYTSSESKGGVMGSGSRTITEYIGANSKSVITLVSWFMDGSAAQEKTEYQNIVALLKQQLEEREPTESSDTYSAWETENALYTVSLADDRVSVTVGTAGEKGLMQRMRDSLLKWWKQRGQS